MMKAVAQTAAAVLSWPMRARYWVLRACLGEDRALSLVSEAAGRRPGLLGLYTRQALYRSVLTSCGRDVHFGYQTLLSKADARIGERVYLGRFCTIGRVTIGDDVRIADGVQLLSGQHHHGSNARGVDVQHVTQTRITIGSKAWIGANAVVMSDVGDGAIVGAGAVVTRPVASGQTVVGVPARPIDQPCESRHAA